MRGDAGGGGGGDVSKVVHDGEAGANAEPGSVGWGGVVGIGGVLRAVGAGAAALAEGEAGLGGGLFGCFVGAGA